MLEGVTEIPGVFFCNNCINVMVSAPVSDWCRILLRKNTKNAGEKPEWERHELKRSTLFPRIFKAGIPVPASTEYEYIFENENGYFLDPYALRINGNEEFGTLSAEVSKNITKASEMRGIISDTMGLTCAVENSSFDWKNDKKPNFDFSDLFIYKLHVRGFTKGEGSGVSHPGTYLGLCEKIKYLKDLGCNAVLLQPCVEFNELMDYQINIGDSSERNIMRTRLFGGYSDTVCSRLNFWGYGAQNFYFAPKSSYASEPSKACTEFKYMVRQFHKAGIEILMEMDYPYCCAESFILENLRFWACEYHIDGFRLNPEQISIKNIENDIFLSNLKIISSGCNGFSGRTGAFTANSDDGFQDTMRRFLKGDEGQLNAAAHIMTDNGGGNARINYVADHNGFTLNDCFCYDERHNEANGEKNADGREANYSWNCGCEGPTKKRRIIELRQKMIRNALTVLFLSKGTPMLCAGDEFGNSHLGNNNPYCCDNEMGYVNWTRSRQSSELRAFVKMLASLRKEHRVFSNRDRLLESDPLFTGFPDVSYHGTNAWYPDFGYYSRVMAILLNGEYAVNSQGIQDCSFYIIINMHWEEHEFDIPVLKGYGWKTLFGTDRCTPKDIDGRSVIIQPRSVMVLKSEKIPEQPVKKAKNTHGRSTVQK